ncbi:MAG: aminopeptidase P family N-terminal domain-containing protein [Hyphomicrobiales bacterium]
MKSPRLEPKLVPVTLPDFGAPEEDEPLLGKAVYAARHARLLKAMKKADYDAVVIYGDREHVANISWASGYDPRFEEALYVVVPGQQPTLFAGNEGLPYAELAGADFTRVLWQPLSLMGQPRDRYKPLRRLLKAAGLKRGMRIGLAGWKGFETEDGEFDPGWFETPHYLVKALRDFGDVENAALLFMHPERGLRSINEAAQLARFEYAATLASDAIRRFVLNAKPGLTEYEACLNLQLNGFPLSTHINMCAGPRAKYGLPSPSSRRLEEGDPIVVGHGLMGALNCRAGFLVRDESGLPEGAKDYVAKLVSPYFAAAAAWYKTVGVGVSGGDIYKAVMKHVGDPFFGVGLNPGHLIHLDEWVHSPIRKDSRMKLVSGMALQCDIIPATGTVYFTSNIEDGVALADEALRGEIARDYPEMWTRIMRRRAFMTGTLGLEIAPELLPFSNMAGWLPPYWLDPGKAMAMRPADGHD